jgi:hypothetical protein
MLDTTPWINAAFRDLLQRVYGGQIPENYREVKVCGRFFDQCRKEIEAEYHLTEDSEMYNEWLTLLMFQEPKFYTDEDFESKSTSV